ncbi:hypothetical protein HDK90DRAFT_512021 [Phyllosticta capitalensis]|uniref:Uncharacterized protein n=1 Tax=Phyllosticta capitalensis TaxID=121624 RepID=A0ABR1YKP9_9PEZI
MSSMHSNTNPRSFRCPPESIIPAQIQLDVHFRHCRAIEICNYTVCMAHGRVFNNIKHARAFLKELTSPFKNTHTSCRRHITKQPLLSNTSSATDSLTRGVWNAAIINDMTPGGLDGVELPDITVNKYLFSLSINIDSSGIPNIARLIVFDVTERPSSTIQLEDRRSFSSTMADTPFISLGDIGERRIANLHNIPDPSMHPDFNNRPLRVDTYTVANASTLQRLEELEEVDFEQLDLEDLEDFDSDDLESVDEFELDDTDLGSLDEDERRTLKQYLDSCYDVRIMCQGRQISRQHAFQIITPNEAGLNADENLQSDDETTSTTSTESGETELGQTSKEEDDLKDDQCPFVVRGIELQYKISLVRRNLSLVKLRLKTNTFNNETINQKTESNSGNEPAGGAGASNLEETSKDQVGDGENLRLWSE